MFQQNTVSSFLEPQFEVKCPETLAWYPASIVDYNQYRVQQRSFQVKYPDDWKESCWEQPINIRHAPPKHPRNWCPQKFEKCECKAKSEENEPFGWWGCEVKSVSNLSNGICVNIQYDGWSHEDMLKLNYLRPKTNLKVLSTTNVTKKIINLDVIAIQELVKSKPKELDKFKQYLLAVSYKFTSTQQHKLIIIGTNQNVYPALHSIKLYFHEQQKLHPKNQQPNPIIPNIESIFPTINQVSTFDESKEKEETNETIAQDELFAILESKMLYYQNENNKHKLISNKSSHNTNTIKLLDTFKAQQITLNKLETTKTKITSKIATDQNKLAKLEILIKKDEKEIDVLHKDLFEFNKNIEISKNNIINLYNKHCKMVEKYNNIHKIVENNEKVLKKGQKSLKIRREAVTKYQTLLNNCESIINDINDQSPKYLSVLGDRVNKNNCDTSKNSNKHKINNGKLCVICLSNEKNTVNVPCGHNCLCKECSNKYKKQSNNNKCPICRKQIKQIIPLFS